MPSLFPGMDPWLENPDHWQDVHTRLAVALADTLVTRVRPRYEVRVEIHVYVDQDPTDDRIQPDAVVVNAGRPTRPGEGQAAGLSAPLVLPTIMETEVTQRFLTVRGVGTGEVVCVIELLSPTNKRGPESDGRKDYLAKRRQVLNSEVHLVELDLLRAGHRVPMRRLPPAAYFAIVSRAGRRPNCEVWPIGLRERLPTIAVPLRGDEQAPLDLQLALDTAYDRAGWDYALDRTRDPVPPLDPDDLAWARALLAKAPPTSP